MRPRCRRAASAPTRRRHVMHRRSGDERPRARDAQGRRPRRSPPGDERAGANLAQPDGGQGRRGACRRRTTLPWMATAGCEDQTLRAQACGLGLCLCIAQDPDHRAQRPNAGAGIPRAVRCTARRDRGGSERRGSRCASSTPRHGRRAPRPTGDEGQARHGPPMPHRDARTPHPAQHAPHATRRTPHITAKITASAAGSSEAPPPRTPATAGAFPTKRQTSPCHPPRVNARPRGASPRG